MSGFSYMIKSKQFRVQPRGKIILNTSLFPTQELSHLEEKGVFNGRREVCYPSRIRQASNIQYIRKGAG